MHMDFPKTSTFEASRSISIGRNVSSRLRCACHFIQLLLSGINVGYKWPATCSHVWSMIHDPYLHIGSHLTWSRTSTHIRRNRVSAQMIRRVRNLSAIKSERELIQRIHGWLSFTSRMLSFVIIIFIIMWRHVITSRYKAVQWETPCDLMSVWVRLSNVSLNSPPCVMYSEAILCEPTSALPPPLAWPR